MLPTFYQTHLQTHLNYAKFIGVDEGKPDFPYRFHIPIQQRYLWNIAKSI